MSNMVHFVESCVLWGAIYGEAATHGENFESISYAEVNRVGLRTAKKMRG